MARVKLWQDFKKQNQQNVIRHTVPKILEFD